MNRRTFSALLAAAVCPLTRADEAAGRTLDFKIAGTFGDAGEADIQAVLKSAAESIWKHCPATTWEVPGFFVFHREESPITLFDHTKDGRISIGLTTKGKYWAQFAYQFSHEFCHALAGHSNDWRKPWLLDKKANHWLEESLCETASLFALRAMGKSWESQAPYPNWKGYGKSLAGYAAERIQSTRDTLAPGYSFTTWFRQNEAAMRANPTLRDKNNVVALELLPLFEATPAGWESIPFYNLTTNRDTEKSLARNFTDWSASAPARHRAFIAKLAAVFEVN